jgi:hypothetical protein
MSSLTHIACPACGFLGEVNEREREQAEPVQCPMCGTWIRDYAAEVHAASQPTPEAADPDSRGAVFGFLVPSDSLALEDPHPLRGSRIVVGRDNADIVTGDPTMSVHHFEIERREGEFFIRDLGSTNCTRVNGQKIRATTLRSGDRIQAGLTYFVFRAV